MKYEFVLVPTRERSNLMLTDGKILTQVSPPQLGYDKSVGMVLGVVMVDIELGRDNVSEGDVCLYDNFIDTVSYKDNSDEKFDIRFGSFHDGCSANFDKLKIVMCTSDYELTPMFRIYRGDITKVCEYYNEHGSLPKVSGVIRTYNNVYLTLLIGEPEVDDEVVVVSSDTLVCDISEVIKRAAYRLYPRVVHDDYNPEDDANEGSRDTWIAGALWSHNNIKK